MCFRQIISISQGLLVPIIACITVYIAYQQLRTNQQKLKLKIYDRRLRIYEEVKKILSLILRTAKPQFLDLMNFRMASSEADFLFDGREIRQYIDEIVTHGLKLEAWNNEYRDYTQIASAPPGYDPIKVSEGMDKELKWFSGQFDVACEKFRKYLDISK